MKFHVDIPYPKIRVMRKNPAYGKLIMHVYAGEVSEQTAIHLYLYQSILVEDDNLEIANILKEISKVEMHHFQILATLIKKLGVYPMYLDPTQGTLEYWTGKNVYYTSDLIEMLEYDIEAETEAISNYTKLIQCIDDIYVTSIIKRIVLDEQVHLEIFQKLLATLMNH